MSLGGAKAPTTSSNFNVPSRVLSLSASTTLTEPSTSDHDVAFGDLKSEIGSSSTDDDFVAVKGDLPSSAGSDRNPFAGEVFSSWKESILFI